MRTGEGDAVPPGDTRRPAARRGVRGWLTSTRVWLVTVLAGALATALTGALLALPGQLFDSSAAKDKLRTGPDFSVTTELVRLDDGGKTAVTGDEFRPSAAERELLARPGSAGTAAYDRLLRAHHAVNTGRVTVRIVLTGRRNQQIDVEDIRPLIAARAAPLTGSILCAPSQGSQSAVNVLYDMDRPFPVARTHRFGADEDGADGVGGADEPEQGLGPPFFAQHTITLRDGEQQVLVAGAVTRERYVAFRLEVDYLLGGARKKRVVDDHGRPFEVSAYVPTPRDGRPAYRSVYRLRQDFSMRRAAPSPTPGGPC